MIQAAPEEVLESRMATGITSGNVEVVVSRALKCRARLEVRRALLVRLRAILLWSLTLTCAACVPWFTTQTEDKLTIYEGIGLFYVAAVIVSLFLVVLTVVSIAQLPRLLIAVLQGELPAAWPGTEPEESFSPAVALLVMPLLTLLLAGLAAAGVYLVYSFQPQVIELTPLGWSQRRLIGEELQRCDSWPTSSWSRDYDPNITRFISGQTTRSPKDVLKLCCGAGGCVRFTWEPFDPAGGADLLADPTSRVLLGSELSEKELDAIQTYILERVTQLRE